MKFLCPANRLSLSSLKGLISKKKLTAVKKDKDYYDTNDFYLKKRIKTTKNYMDIYL